MSTSRREFLRSAILGACALPGWAYSSDRQDLRAARIDRVIFDARQSHALSFADAARRRGVGALALREDVCGRGCRDLQATLQSKRGSLAGMTDFRSLFLLQAMAADYGLQTVLRIHHDFHGANPVHEVFAVDPYRMAADAFLADPGMEWPCAVAGLVTCLPQRGGRARVQGTPPCLQTGNLCEANERMLGSRALVSWVMA